jgi:hypothetical protein
MIETIPLEQAAPAYNRMMVGKARFRVVLVTGRRRRVVHVGTTRGGAGAVDAGGSKSHPIDNRDPCRYALLGPVVRPRPGLET